MRKSHAFQRSSAFSLRCDNLCSESHLLPHCRLVQHNLVLSMAHAQSKCAYPDCYCMRFTLRPNQGEDEPEICRNCGHIESAHPQNKPSAPSSISAILDKMGIPEAPVPLGGLKTTSEQALKEAASGLKRQRAPEAREGSLKKPKVHSQSMIG